MYFFVFAAAVTAGVASSSSSHGLLVATGPDKWWLLLAWGPGPRHLHGSAASSTHHCASKPSSQMDARRRHTPATAAATARASPPTAAAHAPASSDHEAWPDRRHPRIGTSPAATPACRQQLDDRCADSRRHIHPAVCTGCRRRHGSSCTAASALSLLTNRAAHTRGMGVAGRA